MITWTKKRNHIFWLLFSLYFFIFTISPLSCVYEHSHIDRQDIAVKGLRLFIVDKILSMISRDDSQRDDYDSSTVRILLKKKRATLSSVKISKAQAKEVGIISHPTVIPKRQCAATAVQNRGPQSSGYFYSLHSGLSPPSV